MSSFVINSLITNFWTLPVTVIGYSSTNRTYREILKCADLAATEGADVFLGCGCAVL